MSAEEQPPELMVDETLLDESAPNDPRPRRSAEGFGRYHPLAELGRGGTARVVRARDPELHRNVAVKTLLDERASESSLARLLAEARVIAQLEHPAIVPIHDIGRTDEGGLYYVMKEIRGHNLRHLLTRLREGDVELRARWDRTALLRAFVRVCEAVEYAHARGVLHRDLKPSNIVFGGFGAVYVVDWGLARIIGKGRGEDGGEDGRESDDRDEAVAVGEVRAQTDADAGGEAGEPIETHDSHETQHGAVLGTPGYISPEQLGMRSDELDGRSDVWSLGAILYELLTLDYYIHGEAIAGILYATIAARPLDAERLASEHALPRFLAETCAAALAPDRDARLASARVLGDRLQGYLESVRRRDEDVASWIGGHIATTAAQIEAQVLRIQDKLGSLVSTTRMCVADPVAPATVAAWAEAVGLRYREELQRTLSETACAALGSGDDTRLATLYSHLRHDDPSDPSVARMYHIDRFVPLMDDARERHGVSFVYYIDASGFLCARPCLDLGSADSAMPIGFDNRTYTAFVVAAPPANPERRIQPTPPHIDYAEDRLIMAFAQPVYDAGGEFLGVWAMDVPLAALYRDTDISAGPEKVPFIVDRQGFIVVHPALEAYADERAGTELRHDWARIDPRFGELDLGELFANGNGWLRLGDDHEGALLCYQVVSSVDWLVCAVST